MHPHSLTQSVYISNKFPGDEEARATGMSLGRTTGFKDRNLSNKYNSYSHHHPHPNILSYAGQILMT